jgi:hypothetical protein
MMAFLYEQITEERKEEKRRQKEEKGRERKRIEEENFHAVIYFAQIYSLECCSAFLVPVTTSPKLCHTLVLNKMQTR